MLDVEFNIVADNATLNSVAMEAITYMTSPELAADSGLRILYKLKQRKGRRKSNYNNEILLIPYSC